MCIYKALQLTYAEKVKELSPGLGGATPVEDAPLCLEEFYFFYEMQNLQWKKVNAYYGCGLW